VTIPSYSSGARENNRKAVFFSRGMVSEKKIQIELSGAVVSIQTDLKPRRNAFQLCLLRKLE